MDKGGPGDARTTLLDVGEENCVYHNKHMAGVGTELEMMRLDSKTDTNDENDDEEEEKRSSESSDSEEEHGHKIDPNTCKGKVATYLHTNVVQYAVIFLVVIDVVIIVLELLIDMKFIVFPEDDPPSHHNASYKISLNVSTDGDYHGTHDWILQGNDSAYNSNHSGNHSDDIHHPHHHTNKEKAEHVLHLASLIILSIFMVEVCLKIFVEGKHLLKQKAEVFDAIVVIVSFTLDVVFSFVSVDRAAKDAAGLMVMLRLWRVTRVINGVILSVKLDAKKKIEAQKAISRKLERENKKLLSKIARLERENSMLKSKALGNTNTNASQAKLPSPVEEGNSCDDIQPHHRRENNT